MDGLWAFFKFDRHLFSFHPMKNFLHGPLRAPKSPFTKLRLLFLLFFFAPGVYAEPSYDAHTRELLKELDLVVNEKKHFQAERSLLAEKLKTQARKTKGESRMRIYKDIYDLYAHFQTDSAEVYLNHIAQEAASRGTRQWDDYLHIWRAELLGIEGAYKDAFDELSLINQAALAAKDSTLNLYYYREMRTLHGWLSNFSTLSEQKVELAKKVQLYRDSILLFEKPGISRDVTKADNLVVGGQAEEAVELLLPYLEGGSVDLNAPYIHFILSQAYEILGEEEEMFHHLILAATADLKLGITEYQALPLLSQKLHEHGDMERAYRYLICSMEDANFCKAQLRSVEISKIFPIINQAYKQVMQKQQRRGRIFFYALIALALLLIGIVIHIRTQNARLRLLRKQQNKTNRALKETNLRVTETNTKLLKAAEELQQTYTELRLTVKMKEEYIARYLERCRTYLDTLGNLRKTSLRMLKEHKYEELAKILKNEAALKLEQEKFYDDFDAAFLTLFPNFVEKFNALLRPEMRMRTKGEKRLNTELRIFALIRLGVTDSGKIAHFLKFSLATVYNYRSKLRNHALCKNSEFEARVAEL